MGYEKVGCLMDTLFYYMPALIVIAVVSLCLILSDYFHDNLIQRIGLALVCFGSSLCIYVSFLELSDLVRPGHILLNGIAIFAIGTAWKVYYQTRDWPRSKRGDDFIIEK